MLITPQDWSVVVVGHWNRAIFTPAGILKRLFREPENTPVVVDVPLDAYLPWRVRYKKVIVTVAEDKLLVQPSLFKYETLAAAMKVARAGLEALPETPVFAAGYNLNFKSEGYVEALAEVAAHSWDDRFSDEDFKTQARSTTNSLAWRKGAIKATVNQEIDMCYSIAINFDRRSTSAVELGDWLSASVEDVKATTERILFRCLDLAPEDVCYVK